MKRNRRWSLEEIQVLKTLYERGQSITHLSDLFSRTPASVRLKLSRLGIRRGSHKKENGEDLLADLVAVLRGESAPQVPLLVDFFDRLRQEVQERLDRATRCKEHDLPMMPWCWDCQEEREPIRDEEPPSMEIEIQIEESPSPVPVATSDSSTASPGISIAGIPEETLRSRPGWGGAPCSACQRPTYPPRVYSTPEAAWYHPECWDRANQHSS